MRYAALSLIIAAACASTPKPPPDLVPHTPVSLRVERIDGGGVLTLGSLRGKVVAVTVITTWASLALLEVPRYKQLVATHDPKDLVVIAIALDDKKEMVRIFAGTFEIPYYVGTIEDPADFTSEHGPFGPITIIPTSILLTREGQIAARMDGVWPEGVLEAAVDRLVAGSIGSH
jgi:hypothetical protein